MDPLACQGEIAALHQCGTSETGWRPNDAVSGDSATLKQRETEEAVPPPVESVQTAESNTAADHVETERQDSYFELRLDTLPSELILHIFTFIPARVVVQTLSRVCQAFQDLITDQKFWKILIAKRWPNKYPAIPVNDAEFDWAAACIARDETHAHWLRHHVTMDEFRFREGLFAAVDCVHFMKDSTLLAIGSRDRYLNVVDTSRLDAHDANSSKSAHVLMMGDAHDGWVWTACSLDNILATGAWDRYIKFWDMNAGGKEVRKVRCRSAILCTHLEPHFMVAGGYDPRVYHIDPRTCDIVAEKRYHRQPVLSLAVDERFIVTASEDKTVAVFDRRADQVYKTLQMDEFVMRVSYGSDQLWLGDKTGKLHLVDATDGDFNLVESYDVGHSNKMSGLHHSLGSIVTCSTDKTLRVLEPTVSPATIASVPLNTEAASMKHRRPWFVALCISNEALDNNAAQLDVCGDTLAVACTDSCVRIWKPKPRDS